VLAEAKFAVARLQEAKGQPEIALRTYEELVKAGGAGSAAASEAGTRRDYLLAKHPELAKLAAAATTTTRPAPPS